MTWKVSLKTWQTNWEHVIILRKIFFIVSWAKEKKKVWDTNRNQTSDIQFPCSDALPLSHRDSMVSEVCYKVHMTCILHTARVSNVNGIMFVNKIRKTLIASLLFYLQTRCYWHCFLKQFTRRVLYELCDRPHSQ